MDHKQKLQAPTAATKPVDTDGARTSGKTSEFPDAPASVIGEGTPGTPPGMGRAYDDAASGSGNAHGKASSTPAGGNPVYSPVIGNPGEARRDIGYDYGLAAATSRSQTNPRAFSQPVTSVPMLVQVQQEPKPADDTEYAERVRARSKGHYDGLREMGDVFDNPQNLATYPEDPNSWFEDATKPPQDALSQRELLRTRKAKAGDKK